MPARPTAAAEQRGVPRSIESLPGPRGWPWLGSLPQIRTERLHLDLEAWHRVYGDTFQLKLGPRRMVVFADPEVVREALRDRPAGFSRTSKLQSVAREVGINGVFTENGANWQAQRRMVMAAFDPGHLRAYFPALARVTARFLRRWEHHADSAADFDLQSDLMRYTVDAVAGLAFGADINTIDRDHDRIQDHLNVLFPTLNRRLFTPLPYWRWFKLPVDRALDRHLAAVSAAVKDLVTAGRARLAADPARRAQPADLLEAMLVARDAVDSGLSDQDVHANVLTMLLAGEDTTANTLAWLILFAWQDPEVARRLTEEADRVLQDRPLADDLEMAEAMPYADACAQETLRLKPVAPIMLLEAERPTTLGGVAIPAGGLAMLLFRVPGREAHRMQDAGRFLPERWLSSATSAGMPAAHRSLAFGAGPRICPGRKLALLEIKLVVAMLFRNFEIVTLAPTVGAEVEERLNFSMGPSAMRIRLRRRGSGAPGEDALRQGNRPKVTSEPEVPR